MCKCINETNLALERFGNTKLDIPIMFNTQGAQLKADKVTVSTCKRNDHKREKPKRLFATYCPFCGKKYKD